MKRFKKFLSFFLAIVLLLSSAPVDVHATESSETVISVESEYTMIGEEVSVDVLIENNPGILGATLEFSYAEELTLVSATAGEAFSYLTMTKPAKLQSPCRFIWDGTDGIAKDGTIVTLNFTVAEDVELEKALAVSVSVPGGEIIDNDMNYVETTTVDGSVTVVDFKAGDANGDGAINITDVIITRRYLVGTDVAINKNAANVNDDGKVSISDVIILRRYLAGGYDVELLYPTILLCDHVMEETAKKDATCEEDGNIQYWYCTACHKFYSDEYGNHEITEESTKIEKLEHTWVIVPQVDPTYETEGSTEGKYCSVCDYWEVVPQPIDKLKKDEYSIRYYVDIGDSYLESLNIESLNPNPTKYTKQDGLEEVVGLDKMVAGYTFLGWYTEPNGAGTRVTEIPVGSTGTKVLYAHWSKDKYTITFDSPDVDFIQYDTYTVDTGYTLDNPPEYFGYYFVGWSNNDGFIVTEIEPGTTGHMTLHANWTSKRNMAVSYAKYGDPIIIEDDVNGQFLFVYDIGRIESVPLQVIETYKDQPSLKLEKEFEIIDTITEDNATTIANMISNATTRSSGWTLAKEWEQVYTAGSSSEKTKVKTEERTDSQGNVVGGNYFVSNSEGGSSYVSTESGGSSSSSSKITTDTSKGISGTYDASTEKYADAKLGVENTTELEAGASFPVSVVDVSAGVKNTTTVNAEVSSGRKDNTAVHLEGYASSYVGTVDTNDESSYYNVSANQSSTWNSTSGYEKSYQTSRDTAVTKAISDAISETTTYNLSKSLGNTNTTTESVAGTDTRSEEYSTTVRYSKGTSASEKVTLTYDEEAAGHYRIVMAGTVHVYGVVGYDVATASYYTYTFNVVADETHSMLDYSKKDTTFSDCENGVVTFEVPFEVCEYVSSVTGKTGGLEIEKNKVNAFDSEKDLSFDGTVVIPQYNSVDNLDGTYSAHKIEEFDESVFKGKTEIETVVLPMYIKKIPDNAFEGCTNLKRVIAYGVTEIGANAFKGCTNLEDFSVDNMITKIGENAFEGVGKLVQVEKKDSDGNSYYEYKKAGEIKVMAANANVADAIIKSGAKYITLDISEMKDSWLDPNDPEVNVEDANYIVDVQGEDGTVTTEYYNSYLYDKEITVPEGTEYFALISNSSEGRSYSNLQIKSDAKETFISNVKFVDNKNTPLELNSEKVTLARVSVENASGFGLILPAENTELALFETISVSSLSENAVITKNVTLTKASSGTTGKLQLTGNYLICGTLTNDNYLSFVPGKGELKELNEEEYENKLTSITVTFDANGGTSDETSRVVSRDAKIGILPVPERTGYDFVGWYLEDETVVTADTSFSMDTTVYAHWAAKEYQVTWTEGTGKTITVERTESPYVNAATGSLSNGDAIYYGDVLQITYATLDGWTIESYGETEITVTDHVTSDDIYMTVWSDWSDWSTSSVSESDTTMVETKTQYRYSDKNITTSTSSSLSGWTCYNTETVYSDWGAWYGWVEAQAPAASDTCQVEVAKFWRYYYLKCPQCGAEEGLYGTSDCGWNSLNSSHMVEGWSRTPYSATGYQIYQHAAWKGVTNSNNLIQENIIGYSGITPGHTWYFNAPDESKQDVGSISGDSNDVIIRAFSRWRTRSSSLKYYYYKWSDWSGWSDTEYSESDERQVETRTMYRYKTRY